jgi:hypothetical protein
MTCFAPSKPGENHRESCLSTSSTNPFKLTERRVDSKGSTKSTWSAGLTDPDISLLPPDVALMKEFFSEQLGKLRQDLFGELQTVIEKQQELLDMHRDADVQMKETTFRDAGLFETKETVISYEAKKLKKAVDAQEERSPKSITTSRSASNEKKKGKQNKMKEDIVQLLIKSEEHQAKAAEHARLTPSQRVAKAYHSVKTMNQHQFEMTVDSTIGIFIVINAFIIGIDMQYNSEAYPEWKGHWLFVSVSVFMCLLFTAELILKLKLHGPRKHYSGSDFFMNTFDTIIVCADLLLLIGELAASLASPIPPSLFRLIRLVRLTRLLRLLRAPIFQNLLAMIYGIMGGFTTLLWSLLLLILMVYFFALLFVVLVGDGEEEEQQVPLYFADVPRSFLTTYRCSFGDCSDQFGVSLFEHSYNYENTKFFTLVLGAFGFFFWVGLFNVIAAIFVESTLTAATQIFKTKKAERLNDFVLWSDNISQLVRILWSVSGYDENLLLSQHVDEIMRMDIPCEVLKEAVLTPDARKALNNLDICEEDHEHLHFILDPDMGGSVTVSDIVDGLERLRGDPRRSDIVTLDLMLRNILIGLDDLQADVSKRGRRS